tara:strand:+ start:134 stop:1639 length:1506 start_codon:yes stop_codon:yes gene_type:complete
MLKKDIKISLVIPFFNPSIICLFFIVFLFSNNLSEDIEFIEIFSLFTISALFSFLILAISILILKTIEKASFFSSISLFLFFSYGYFYKLFNEIIILKEISRHRYIVPIIAILFLYFLFKIIKSRRKFIIFHKIFFISFLSLTIVNSLLILNYDLGPSRPITEDIEIEINKRDNLPDVYHIVLDFYADEDILRTRFDFDNNGFINELNSLGFKKENLKVNYEHRFIMPSITNMKHFYGADEDEKNYMNETYFSFDKSVEAHIAKKLGYEVIEISTIDDNFFSAIFGDFSKIFLRTSMLSVVDDSPLPIHNLWLSKKQRHFRENFNKLLKIHKNPEMNWVYFYSTPPHPPFIFNSDGPKELNDDDYNKFTIGDIKSISTKENYIEQLKYVNKVTLETIREILKNSSNSIIIIHSEDGMNYSNESLVDEKGNIIEEVFHELFSTISFIYTPDNCIDDQDNIETNINIISRLFRECFDLEIPDNENNIYWTPANSERFNLIKLK